MKNRSVIITAFLFLIFMGPFSVFARETSSSAEVTAQADKYEANIGDRIDLSVRPVKKASGEYSFTEEPAELGEFVFVGSRPLDRGIGREYVVSIYTTGTHVVPPIPVKYRARKNDDWNIIWSPQVPINIKTVLTGEEKDIKDLKGIILFWYSPIIVVFAVIGLILIAAGFYFFRRKKKTQTLMESEQMLLPHDRAYKLLSQLKAEDLPAKRMINEYYVRLSDIVRHYLEERFSFRAPEMTTEEFLEFVKRSEELQRNHKELLKDFLSHCDMVKFAKYGPAPIEMIDAYTAAEKLVEETKELPEEEAEEE